VPGTICTLYSEDGDPVDNPGIINGDTTGAYGTLNANQGAAFVSVYWDGAFTHWVQLYWGSA
jgi:hypothetical protein